ncbi:MAG: cellulosome protein [Prevotella sp.]|nr:cellulosome protein [Prevotella sp.]
MEGHYGIAYLDGLHPSLIMECEDRDTGGSHHGYVLTWDFDWNGTEASNWHHSHTWVRNPKRPGCVEFHQIRILDSDGDGCDEMWAGGYGVNPAQDRFTSTGIGHGDRFIISDIDPDRPGLEGYAIQQSALLGQILYDARTAEPIKEWYLPSLYDVGRGACLDIDAAYKGYEILSYADEFVYDCKGEKTGQTRSGSMYEGVWWDGRLQREWLNSPGGSGWGTNVMITRVLGDRLCEFSQESSWATHGGTGTRPAFMGDITGDWREEIILAKQNENGSTGLVGYTTNIPTTYSIYCLQQDPHYRLDCTTRGYYQHPNTGFYLGGDMAMPPLPPVFTADVRNEMATGQSVLFDLTGSNSSPIVLNGEAPTVLYLMNPRGHDYTFEGTGIAGTGMLMKSMQGTATFNCNLGHQGLTLISEGTLCVNGSIEGPVELRARGTLSGNATLNSTTSFEGALNYEGCRLLPVGTEGVITFKQPLTLPGNMYIEVEAADGKSGKLKVEGDLTFSGANCITVNLASQDAGRYVIAECTGTLTCDVSKLNTRGLEGVNFDFVVEDNKRLVLVVNATRAPALNVAWTGSESNVWNYKAQNFDSNGPTSFVSGDQVVFGEAATNKTVNVPEMMVTGGVIFDAGKYVLSGDGGLSGEGGVTVNAAADVTLNMKYSDYTGATVVNGGKLTVPNFYDGGQKSAIGASTAASGNLDLNGGTLVLQKDNMATDHIINLTDTATITISQSNSALSLKGQVKGTGYLIKDGPGRINFTYGGANNFAGLILKKGSVAQGAWNSTFGRSGSPMVLAGGEVALLDQNNSSTMPVFNHVATVEEGTTNTIVGTSRGKINGSFKGKGTLTIRTKYVRCDIGANFSDFEGQLNAVGDGGNFRLMSSVTDMSKTKFFVGAGTYVAHNASGGGSEVAGTTKIGTLLGTATDGTLGGAQSTYQVGFRNEDSRFSGLLKASRVTKVGDGTLTLVTPGHTAPITVSGGVLMMQNATTTVFTTALVTVAEGGTLQGNALLSAVTVQKGGTLQGGIGLASGTLRLNTNLILQQGATMRCLLGASTGGTQISVKGNITHNGDTLLIVVPASRQLAVGDEVQVFAEGFAKATGNVIVRCESENYAYEFDTSTLNTDGKVRVASKTDAVRGVVADGQTLVDVYSADGVLLRRQVPVSESLKTLPRGVYIVGGVKTVKK